MPCSKDLSRVEANGRARAGSQRQIQTYVNEKTAVLNSAIAQVVPHFLGKENSIQWVSPLAADQYSEYQDTEFLDLVGLTPLVPKLEEFWPKGGPCWDALAKTGDGCLFVEAKSRTQEIRGRGCQAESPRSVETIRNALNATKAWVGAPAETDWMGQLYQPANRYAHLYFLRQAGIPAFPIDVYFIGDPHKGFATSREEWERAIAKVDEELGLTSSLPFSAAIFLQAE